MPLQKRPKHAARDSQGPCRSHLVLLVGLEGNLQESSLDTILDRTNAGCQIPFKRQIQHFYRFRAICPTPMYGRLYWLGLVNAGLLTHPHLRHNATHPRQCTHHPLLPSLQELRSKGQTIMKPCTIDPKNTKYLLPMDLVVFKFIDMNLAHFLPQLRLPSALRLHFR